MEEKVERLNREISELVRNTLAVDKRLQSLERKGATFGGFTHPRVYDTPTGVIYTAPKEEAQEPKLPAINKCTCEKGTQKVSHRSKWSHFRVVCTCGAAGSFQDSEREAIEAWNSRA